jgi:ubiquinone/menaquinone biosynthesis C-methylase UbiE
VEPKFQRDLSHLSWEEVYARQARRSHLMGEWMDALRLEGGERVLEIGAGPGFVSLALADRVGPGGIVYAVDRAAPALAHLERLQKERGISNIRRIVADAATLEPGRICADCALITMVLHHAEDKAAILRNAARLLRPGARVVVAEFHPEGPSEQGPPPAVRLSPAQVQAWCEAAGFSVLDYRRQTPEHYMLLVQGPRQASAG